MASTIREREITHQLETAQPPRKSLAKIIALRIIESTKGKIGMPLAALKSEAGERIFGFSVSRFAQDELLAESRGDIVLTPEPLKDRTIKLLDIYYRIDGFRHPRKIVSFLNYLKKPEKISQTQMV